MVDFKQKLKDKRFQELALMNPTQIAEVERKALEGFKDNGHALISPSGASRWSRCIGSMVGLHAHRRTAPDNLASVEGTTAHYLLELSLHARVCPTIITDHHYGLDGMSADEFSNEVWGWHNNIVAKANQPKDVLEAIPTLVTCILNGDFTPDMRMHVKKVYDKIMEYVAKGYTLMPEMRVSLKKYFGHSQCDGSGDGVLFKGDHLIIADLKYGVAEEVFPEENDQLSLYGLGACAYVKDTLGIDINNVDIVVCQPRVNNRIWDSWSTDISWLMSYAAKMKVSSLRALIAIGEPEKITNADYEPGASTCKYCHRRELCPERRELAMKEAARAFELAEMDTDDRGAPTMPANDDISDENLAEIMAISPFILSFLKDIEKLTYKRVNQGRSIGGRKLVKGRMARKYRVSDDAVINTLVGLGVPRVNLIETKIKSPAKMDTVEMTSACRSALEGLVNKTYGSPVVALKSDRREAVSVVVDAAEAFNKPAGNER